jgi:nitrite reductase/ring-hydroxylating ferredoxin subunit
MLFDALIDYAGIFPPAALSLPDAVAEYRVLRAGEWATMVGPFLVKSSLLDQLDTVGADPDWPIGIVGDEAVATVVDKALASGRPITQIEFAVRDADDVAAAAPALGRLPVGPRVFVEATGDALVAELVAAIATLPSAHAKIRTGGTAPGSTVPDDTLVAFMRACVAHGLAWKATAGLHQPFRHHEPSIGEDQHGFLNVMAATWAVEQGASDDDVVSLLAAPTLDAVAIPPARVRQRMLSFGSCSVMEPVEGLLAHRMLTSWTSVAKSDDIAAGATLAVDALGEKLVAVRLASGTAHVFARFCPHLGANLARLGVVKGETLQCTSHKWTYDCDGACVAAPGEDELPTARLTRYPTREHDGVIEVSAPS